ncbi:MAG: dienelactone hydrolase family protein [Chloroflexi bacterium]|nr:dienelactone hydrolase family protein [Chloroflexota bacterium]MDA1002779.1 dienelactone hydrolase family protein [Chloroflexota bacterium]
MCFEIDAMPPIPVIAGAAIDSEDLVLEAADGNKFAAFSARASEPLGPAVVVLPDVRGLFRFYEELALRFAERGYDSIAFDYFGRTSGVGKRGADFDFMPEVQKTTADGINADVAAVIAELRKRDGHADRKVFTIGFCFGGSNSWKQASAGHGLSGAIGFYGMPIREFPAPAPIAVAGDAECPILGLMGGTDQMITKEAIDEYAAALTAAGKEHVLVTYHGAPHSFFDRSFEEHAAASADAWGRVLGFIEAHS